MNVRISTRFRRIFVQFAAISWKRAQPADHNLEQRVQRSRQAASDMDVGWVHPWVGLGSVGFGSYFWNFRGLGWVGSGENNFI